MKKFMQLALALMFAATLSACDNGNQSNSTQNTAKAESTLSAKEQFRQDYEAFAKWQNQAQQKFNAEVAKLQQEAANQARAENEEEAKKVLSHFRDQVTESNKELDALNVKDEEVKALVTKMKALHEASVDAFDFIIKAAGDKKNANKHMQVIQEKLQGFQQLQVEIQQISEKLDQKYRQQ